MAEITGRKCRLAYDEETGRPYHVVRAKELGCTQKAVNINEMANFQRGDKLVAIISDAGSTGISLHADRRAGNQRCASISIFVWIVLRLPLICLSTRQEICAGGKIGRWLSLIGPLPFLLFPSLPLNCIVLLHRNSRRVHITLEIPFNSTQFVQQLGRSHRSNQVSGPEYQAIITDLPGMFVCVFLRAGRTGKRLDVMWDNVWPARPMSAGDADDARMRTTLSSKMQAKSALRPPQPSGWEKWGPSAWATERRAWARGSSRSLTSITSGAATPSASSSASSSAATTSTTSASRRVSCGGFGGFGTA